MDSVTLEIPVSFDQYGEPLCYLSHRKHSSAGPSIQPEIQCVETKGNLHGEKQRQTTNLPKAVDTRGNKDAVVLSQGKGKGHLCWAKQGRNEHVGEVVL